MKPRVVVIGGGGHAKVLVEILEQSNQVEIAGFVSMRKDDTLYEYPWLGNDEALSGIYHSGIRSAVLAIGDNRRRAASMDVLRGHGFQLVNAISPAAILSKSARLGKGIAILPGAIVNAAASLDDGVIVNTNASVDHDCIVGLCVHVAPGATVAGCVRLEEGVFLGTGSSVIPGVKIGGWTTVGAGAVVVADLPSHVVAVGVPAAVLKTL